MDIQSTFYLLGIVFMTLCIVILLGIVILLFYIKKKVGDIHKFIEMRVNEITELTLKPMRKATEIAKNVLSTSSNKPSKK